MSCTTNCACQCNVTGCGCQISNKPFTPKRPGAKPVTRSAR